MEFLAAMIRLPVYFAGVFFLTLGYLIFIPLVLVLYFVVVPVCIIVALPFKFVMAALTNDLASFQYELKSIKEFFELKDLRQIFQFNPYRQLFRWLVGENAK